MATNVTRKPEAKTWHGHWQAQIIGLWDRQPTMHLYGNMVRVDGEYQDRTLCGLDSTDATTLQYRHARLFCKPCGRCQRVADTGRGTY